MSTLLWTELWKDYRQTRKVLLATSVFVLAPYAILLGLSLAEELHSTVEVQQAMLGASAWSAVLAAGMAAFVAGNALAGERADRSAEFAAYLPIRRGTVVTAKAMLAAAMCLLLQLPNVGIVAICQRSFTRPPDFPAEFMLYTTASTIAMFGAAWFISSFLSSPAISAAAGLAALGLLAGTLRMLQLHRQQGLASHLAAASRFNWFAYYPELCVVLGLIGFVAGTLCYLRRVEP